MIKIENEEVLGWEHAIRGMRNPMNSWDKSDTNFPVEFDDDCNMYYKCDVMVGYNDLDLMKILRKAGADHRKYMRMIVVYLDITAPLYWWKEFDTYKVGTVVNSCSTMHKIHAKEFTLNDFSTEHLISTSLMNKILNELNVFRNAFIETKDKKYWWQMIQLLPSSYNQKRTVMLNYEVLVNMYKARNSHKLDEWRAFCNWIEQLPHSELITGEFEDEDN